jgi:hypothetical protein
MTIGTGSDPTTQRIEGSVALADALGSFAAMKTMTQQHFPPGWDEARVKRLIARYDSMSEDELVAEDEASGDELQGQTVITVPDTLLPAIRQMLAGTESS